MTVSSPNGAPPEEHLAEPEVNGSLHSVVSPTEKVTVPVGVGPDPLTVAE